MRYKSYLTITGLSENVDGLPDRIKMCEYALNNAKHKKI